jgi:hypothetical protein
MTARTFSRWIFAGLVTAGLARTSHAQPQDAFCGPACDFNTQWFAPVDFDYDCLPIKDDCGYFFKYDKLSWSMTGERTTIGQRGLVVPSEVIHVDTVAGEGTPPQGYAVQNGIQEAAPDADFGWGDRYEIGHRKNGVGWSVGVIDGPKVASGAIYGFQAIEIPNTLPIITQDDDNFDPSAVLQLEVGIPVGDGDAGGGDNAQVILASVPLFNINPGSANLSTSRNGFGSVHVNFEVPNADYLKGFRDYNFTGLFPGPTAAGPGRILEVTGAAATFLNGELVDLQITDATIISGGDGIADNLDGDNLGTFFAILDADDNVIAYGIDFDDLHLFNVAFDSLTVRNVTETTGVEIMKTHELGNRHKFAKHQNRSADIGYGVRFFRLRDDFYWEGKGGILGRTYADTKAENQLVGPQIRARWSQQHGRWNLGFDSRFMFGYNIQDLGQITGVGEDLSPGALNSLANAQPTFSSYGAQENTFSPLVEIRAEASYQITGAIAAKLGYTGIFVDNITRASEIVRYRLPDMGIRSGGNQEIFINGVNFGFEAVY